MEFEWDRNNLREITPHGVYPAHAEDALRNRPLLQLPTVFRGNDWRLTVAGRDNNGRILVVVFTARGERIRVITAYPARPSAQREYRRLL